LIKDLHPILRIYVGCAELLAGDLQNFDLIKLHKRSGKVSLMRYDDFEGNPLPVLVERVKVDLSRQKVDIFDHGSSRRHEVLFFKERYVSEDHENRGIWEKFSERLTSLGLSLETGYGPSRQEMLSIPAEKGLAAAEFMGDEDLVPLNEPK
jgi:DNA phosphorothioation-associated putative methyltransferase